MNESTKGQMQEPMAITCSIDHDRRYMQATARGAVACADILAHLQEEHSTQGLNYPELIDGREATAAWSSREAHDIVDRLKTLGRESGLGPTAVLVSSDHAYGMIRMLELLLEGVCAVRPFRDLETAKNWLLSQSRPVN